MPNDAVALLQQSPLPELIERLGVSIANAQYAIDRKAVEIAKLLADPANGLKLGDDEQPRTLLELGFTPTFYQLTEATIEAKVTFSVGQSSAFSIGAKVGVNLGYFAASVDASYSAKYSFDATGSSAITARFVSVPPPAIFQDRLRASISSKES